jgi:hypothetical protein
VPYSGVSPGDRRLCRVTKTLHEIKSELRCEEFTFQGAPTPFSLLWISGDHIPFEPGELSFVWDGCASAEKI